jgi:hypothetical protein
MADAPETVPIGWFRAILTAAVIAVVGIALLVYVPNAVLTHATSIGRSARVAIATTEFFVALFVLAFALRKLQRRKII